MQPRAGHRYVLRNRPPNLWCSRAVPAGGLWVGGHHRVDEVEFGQGTRQFADGPLAMYVHGHRHHRRPVAVFAAIGRLGGQVIDDEAALSRLIAAWTWKPGPEPALGALNPHGRTWEMSRYRAYQARLANRPVGETFTQDTAFMSTATATATDGILSRT